MPRPRIIGLRELLDAAATPATVETIAATPAATTALIADGERLFEPAIQPGHVWCRRCGQLVAATAPAIRGHRCTH